MERELFIVYTSELFRAKHPYEITEKDPEIMTSFHQELEKKYGLLSKISLILEKVDDNYYEYFTKHLVAGKEDYDQGYGLIMYHGDVYNNNIHSYLKTSTPHFKIREEDVKTVLSNKFYGDVELIKNCFDDFANKAKDVRKDWLGYSYSKEKVKKK